MHSHHSCDSLLRFDLRFAGAYVVGRFLIPHVYVGIICLPLLLFWSVPTTQNCIPHRTTPHTTACYTTTFYGYLYSRFAVLTFDVWLRSAFPVPLPLLSEFCAFHVLRALPHSLCPRWNCVVAMPLLFLTFCSSLMPICCLFGDVVVVVVYSSTLLSLIYLQVVFVVITLLLFH